MFLAGFCHMDPLCAGTARTKWSRFEPRSHALEKFSCCVLEGPNRQTRQLISFPKENTVCFTVKTVWFILSIEDNCDIFIYSCYNLTSFFPAVSWSIIGISKHLSTSCTKERVIFIPLISFPKENTVCLSIEDDCDIFMYSCYNLTSFFPCCVLAHYWHS